MTLASTIFTMPTLASAAEPRYGGGDLLVRRGEGHPYVLAARRTVELAGSDQDPKVGEARDRLPAGLVAGRPQVERGLRMIDAKPVRQQRLAERGPPPGVARPLLVGVLIVAERRRHRRLHRRGHHHPGVLAYPEQPLDHGRVAGEKPGPVASQVGPLGQRMHRE